MAYAIQLQSPGGAEQLAWCPVDPGTPGPGQVRISQKAAGVNFIDIYHRTGLYALPSYPSGIGLEGAGIVEQCGKGVEHVAPGQRVAYAGGAPGAYAQSRVIDASLLVPIPDAVSFEQAAAVMLKGLTAGFLVRQVFPVQRGQQVLVHAAAGGVGPLLCQWAAHLGARVIGTVGSEDKAALARKHGCHETILYREESVAARVRELTGGEGVDAAFDSVGQATFAASLDSLRRFGMLVSFGQSSGPVPPLDVLDLQKKGSLYLTRPSLLHFIEDRARYRNAAQELFSLLAGDVLSVHIGHRLPLERAAEAHRMLEARQTSGAVVLIP